MLLIAFHSGVPGRKRVRLKEPEEFLPEDLIDKKYLGISKEGPGLYLEMTSKLSVDTTDFHILETDRLHICSMKGIFWPLLVSKL